MIKINFGPVILLCTYFFFTNLFLKVLIIAKILCEATVYVNIIRKSPISGVPGSDLCSIGFYSS